MALKLDFGKLPWHAQLGAFAFIALAGVGAFWYFYASPKQATLVSKRAEVKKLQVQIKDGLATAKRLPEFRKEVVVLEAQLDRLRAVLPEEQDVAELLRRVQGMATQSNLSILTFAPHPTAKKQLHAEWPITLKLEGNYHDLGSFLERVSKFPRIINVGDIKISARNNQSDGSTITAECTATTFVLLDQKEVAEAAAKAAGAKPGAAPAAPKKTE